MISFPRLGRYGMLGNQLFQYAFLRTTAKRLGVKFYCPPWIGDKIFLLGDRDERSDEAPVSSKVYQEPKTRFGFNRGALEIEDGTDVLGFFQTEKYFDRRMVEKWFSFKEEQIGGIKKKYQRIDFSNATGLHLRFGDKEMSAPLRAIYYNPPPSYYDRALSRVKRKKSLLMFSDDPGRARKHLGEAAKKFVFIENNQGWEDLYLMTQCHDLICSGSTLSWWGGWLNRYEDRIVVAPQEGPVRPGYHKRNNDYWPEEWVKIRALRPVLDDYRLIGLPRRVLKEIGTILKRLFSGEKSAGVPLSD